MISCKMNYMTKGLKIIKKGLMFSGAIARTLIGVSAAALLIFSIKKKKPK